MDRAYPFIKSASNGDKRKLETPNDYHRYAHWCVKCQFPPEIRHELSRDHGPDPGSGPGRALDQEVLTLAWEAYSYRLPLKQAGSHIRRGLYAFVRSVGWGRLWDRAGGPHLVGRGPKRQYTRSPRWERVILYGQD